MVNCQDGPREGVTFGVTYTGQVSIPTSGPPCISQSKAVYSQFQFGDPVYAGFEGLAKNQMHQTLDDRSISAIRQRAWISATHNVALQFMARDALSAGREEGGLAPSIYLAARQFASRARDRRPGWLSEALCSRGMAVGGFALVQPIVGHAIFRDRLD